MLKMIKTIKNKLDVKKIIIVIVGYLIYVNFFKGYIAYLPTIPIYPNNKEEVELVKQHIKTRKQEDIDFFHLTNKSIVPAFLPHVEEKEQELKKIIGSLKVNSIVYGNKIFINRARPAQVCGCIKPIDTSTAETPAYPAGHAFQAYLLCKILCKKYPDKKSVLEKTARRCDMCRVKAGLHYPSDGEYSKKLVNIFYE
tara:strand:- start:764 stop:1354 length:591 start_codon:yes stop_codon:yes gene_type:complete